MNNNHSDILLTARELRMRSYKIMYLLDGEQGTYIEDFSRAIAWVSHTCRQMVATVGHTPHEEAEICLSVLVGSNVTVRQPGLISQVVQRAQAVLPKLPATDRLRLHLLIFLYGESEDPRYARQAHAILSLPAPLTQEDHWALQHFCDVEEAVRKEKLSY